MKKIFSEKFFFFVLLITVGFLAMQVPFSKLLGAENIRFSLFDFYGPIAGAFVGSISGVVSVLIMQLVNWGIHGFTLDMGTAIRLFPVLFSVLYFARRSRLSLLVPAVCMIAFWAHPEGRAAWYYALYWTIPFLAYPFYNKFLFARALGATFTQHAVGGALWIWALNMKASLWIGLIPIVWKERMLMALGISLTYIVCNYLLGLITTKTKFKLSFLPLHPKYRV